MSFRIFLTLLFVALGPACLAVENVNVKVQFILWGGSIQDASGDDEFNGSEESGPRIVGSNRELFFFSGDKVESLMLDGSADRNTFSYFGPPKIQFYDSHPGLNPEEPTRSPVLESPDLSGSKSWLYVIRISPSAERFVIFPINVADVAFPRNTMVVYNNSTELLAIQIGSKVERIPEKSRNSVSLSGFAERKRIAVKVAGKSGDRMRILHSFYLPRLDDSKHLLVAYTDASSGRILSKYFRVIDEPVEQSEVPEGVYDTPSSVF